MENPIRSDERDRRDLAESATAQASKVQLPGSSPRADLRAAVGWLLWAPWVLAFGFAVCCVVVLVMANKLRHETATAQLRLAEMSRKAGDLADQLAAWQGDTQARATNFQAFLTNFQRQILQKTLELERQKNALESQLKEKASTAERERDTLQRQLDSRLAENQTLQAALTKMLTERQDRLAPLRILLLTPVDDLAPAGLAAVLWDGSIQRGMFQIQNLLPPPPGQDYQLWLHDPKYPIPISAGILPPAERGTLRYSFKPVFPIENLTQASVSLERKGGSAKQQGRVELSSR